MPQVDMGVPRTAPSYPGFEALYGVGGTARLRARIDANGNAENVEVDQSSGSAVLDEAAMRVVRQWKFRPGHFDGKPASGTAIVPVSFRPSPLNVPRNWPAGYDHPHYNVVPLDAKFTTVDALLADVMQRSKGKAPGDSLVTTYSVRSPQGELLERWTFTDLGTPQAMAIRQVFSMVDGQPTVSVATFCDDHATCESRARFVAQGPLYATSSTAPAP
ncbi:energy transducer TonB [Bacillus sp. NP157]|nr:energy transducer TonB [Bacillus sp. NP157]